MKKLTDSGGVRKEAYITCRMRRCGRTPNGDCGGWLETCLVGWIMGRLRILLWDLRVLVRGVMCCGHSALNHSETI
nr:hypothetical protein GZ26E7_27 [uncultured archaeon GZfos26E7]